MSTAATGSSQSKRQIYMDYLRVFATYAVVLWHSEANVYDSWDGRIREWLPASLTVGLLVRWSVPVFVMISGALLLPREEPMLPFYKKRLTRILIPLAVWLIVYGSFRLYFFTVYSTPFPSFVTVVLGEAPQLFLKNTLSYHFYFISIILNLYLFTPMLSRMLTVLPKRYLEVLLAVGIIIYTLRVFYASYFLLADIQIGSYLIYFLLGYYLVTYPPDLTASRILYAAAICLSMLAFYGSFWREYDAKGHSDTYYKTSGLVIYVLSAAIFVFFRRNIKPVDKNQRPGVWRRFIDFVSTNSYGIFLAHPLVINILLYGNFRFYSLTWTNFTLKLANGKTHGFNMNPAVGGYFLSFLVFTILLLFFYLIGKLKLTKYFA